MLIAKLDRLLMSVDPTNGHILVFFKSRLQPLGGSTKSTLTSPPLFSIPQNVRPKQILFYGDDFKTDDTSNDRSSNMVHR